MSTIIASNLQASGGTGTAATLASINGGPIAGARNRVINGDCRIDQRNAGAAVTAAGSTYVVDRFLAYRANGTGTYTAQQSSVAPASFNNSILATVTSAGTSGEALIQHVIEGFNTADFNLGTANARTFTLSFWVRSSVTGTYSVAFRSTGGGRSYVTTYAISSANVWEQKTVTVPGDTTGTWDTTNGQGMLIAWWLGGSSLSTSTLNTWQSGNFVGSTGSTNLLGTNGATFYLTGVQLEAGTVATPFERRSYGQELALCQRYCALNTSAAGYANTTTNMTVMVSPPVEMRASPSVAVFAGTNGVVDYNVSARNISAVANNYISSGLGGELALTIASSTSGKPHGLKAGTLIFTIEL